MGYEFEIIGRGTVTITFLDLVTGTVYFTDSIDGDGSASFEVEGFPTVDDAKTAIEAVLSAVL